MSKEWIMIILLGLLFWFVVCQGSLVEGFSVGGGKVLAPSERPQVTQIDNFLSVEECEHLINHCSTRFKRSGVMTKAGGTSTDNIRTSSSCFLGEGSTDIIKRIEKRAADLVGVDVDQIEGLQMVRYHPGQKYDAHNDWFHHKNITNNRYATILVYLNDGFKDGNTDFVKLGVSAKPKRGRAIMWYNCAANQTDKCYDEAQHRGAPPSTGVKYALNIWIRFKKYRGPGGDRK